MQNPAKCHACGEHGHCPSRCKAIAIPPDGFFTGGGGGGGHSHDDEDESVDMFMQTDADWPGAQNDSAGGESPPTSPMRAAAARNSPNTPSNAVV